MSVAIKREEAVTAQAAVPYCPGKVLAGKYRIEQILGEGGMGVVVAATHLQLDQRVAIKFLLPEALKNAQAVERFTREARVAAKIRSEHVVRVRDVGTLEDGAPYMVMEHLEGCDLGELLDVQGPLPIEDTAEYVLQACEALAEVHAAGIIHRDLKPANIYLTVRPDNSPVIKLLDFGISKFTVHPDDPKLEPALTATTAILGSPGYMSPEQLKSTRDVDPRADIWALGTILYELLTGTPAFFGETIPQLCAMIASEDPPLPSSLRKDLPLAMERAVLRCLEKKPDRRFQNVLELARALAEFAPERAQVSLERIGGALAPGERRPLMSTPVGEGGSGPIASRRRTPGPRVESGRDAITSETALGVTQASPGALPVLPLANGTRATTRRSRGRGGFLLLLLVVFGGVGFAAYTGLLDVRALSNRIMGAALTAASSVGDEPPAPSASVATPVSTATAVSTAIMDPTPVGTTSAATTASAIASASAAPVLSASAGPLASAPAAAIAIPSASASAEPEPSAEALNEAPTPPATPPPTTAKAEDAGTGTTAPAATVATVAPPPSHPASPPVQAHTTPPAKPRPTPAPPQHKPAPRKKSAPTHKRHY